MADKILKDKIDQGRQYRAMRLEVRAAENKDEESFIVEGYATTFNEPYTLYEGGSYIFREQVAPEAFDNCDMSDVIMQYDHVGHVYARCSNETLSISKDEHGLLIRADLSGTTEGRKLYEEIKGGYTNKMSFGFMVRGDKEECTGMENQKDVYLRTITDISKLYDVSAVSIPANDGTEISARAYVDGVMAKRDAEKAIEEQKQKEAEEQKRREELEHEMRERARKRALAL